MTLLISGHNAVTMLIAYSKLSSTFSPKKVVQPARDRITCAYQPSFSTVGFSPCWTSFITTLRDAGEGEGRRRHSLDEYMTSYW